MTSVRPKTQPAPVKKPTLYALFGLPPSASFEELHANYIELAAGYHSRGNFAEGMAELNLAWATLRDVTKRKLYDRQLRAERTACVWCCGNGTCAGYRRGKWHASGLVCEKCKGAGYV